MAFASPLSSSGCMYMEWGPPASSRQEPVAPIAGTPLFNASSKGIPNPSKKEGYTKVVAI